MSVDYRYSVMHGRDARTTLDFSVAGGSSIVYDGTRYELESYHFHTPSEHAIDGEYAAGEVHFVHRSADGERAVMGVFIGEGEMAKPPVRLEQAVAMKSLVPESMTYYAYEGSLTTPPYTEGVRWIVLTERIEMHSDWLSAFSDRYGANNRALQALNGRTVCIGSPAEH